MCPALSGPALALQVPESALASLSVMGSKSLKGAGGMSRIGGFIARSWGVLGALGAHFASFFRFFFYFDFLLILSRFRRGFGKVLGGQNCKKLRFLVFFGVCIWKFYFW